MRVCVISFLVFQHFLLNVCVCVSISLWGVTCRLHCKNCKDVKWPSALFREWALRVLRLIQLTYQLSCVFNIHVILPLSHIFGLENTHWLAFWYKAIFLSYASEVVFQPGSLQGHDLWLLWTKLCCIVPHTSRQQCQSAVHLCKGTKHILTYKHILLWVKFTCSPTVWRYFFFLSVQKSLLFESASTCVFLSTGQEGFLRQQAGC